MTLNFPANPANEDIFLGYIYDATEGVWNANPRQLASRFVTSATTPAEASNGDGWFNTTNGKTYIFYYDGTSGQWVESGYPVLGYQTLENLSDTTIATPTNGQVLKYNGSDWVNDTDNVGKILQVVSTTKTDGDFSTASTTYVDVTGLSVSITPSSTSSKILVFVSLALTMTASELNRQVRAQILRNSTAIGGGASVGSRPSASFGMTNAGGNRHNMPSAYHFLDTPATTSATTYKVQGAADTAGATFLLNKASSDNDNANTPRFASTITVMEVAG